MASNDKGPLENTRESLLNLFDFFENAMLRVQYPREYPACSRLNHCDRFSHYCASLAEERRNKKEDVLLRPTPKCVESAGVVLQRRFLATLIVLLLIKTLEMSCCGS